MKKRLTAAQIQEIIRSQLAVSPQIAGAALGLGKNASYEAVHRGDIESIRLGGKIVCPTAPLRRQLGIDDKAAA